MKSVMQHSFAKIPTVQIGRSLFQRDSGHKTAIDADYLYPVYVDEILPGDQLTINPTFFARMSTPIYPIMDNLYLDHFWFAVPIRLVYDNWEKLLGAQDNPGDSIDYTVPQQVAPATTGYSSDTLQDYLGLPPGIPDFSHNALPLRCYNLIWNQWFRDENLQNSITVDTGAGPDTVANYTLQKRGKRADYFTSCLPWPQKGDTAVSLPLGTSAPVIGDGNELRIAENSAGTTDYIITSNTGSNLQSAGSGAAGTMYGVDGATNRESGWIADLSTATAATINAIRLAVTTQQFLERDARGGTRIQEILLSHFGVRSLDARLQIPEYLGGGSTPVSITQVPQTSQTATTPQGTLAAFGTALQTEGGFTKAFTEHCYVFCLVNVRADLTYQKGLERMWSRSTRYDFFWPEFQNIGEQAVLQQEIELTDPAGGTNDDVWGYSERYAEYKYKPSRLSSVMRSTHASSLDPWHLSEELSGPALDSTFIPSNTPMARVQAVTSEPDFILDCYFSARHVRPMQIFGEPGLARF